MEKQQLVTKLNDFFASNDFSVDLYFVFKTGDVYVQYIADPDSDLRTKLIDEFITSLSIWAEPNNQFDLNDIYDDNEYADYHLYFDSFENNKIADSIFNFKRMDVLPYESKVGNLSKIHGFVIELSNGKTEISIYKRNQPTNAINPKNAINFFTGTDNKLKLIQQNSTYLNNKIDLFVIDNVIFINSRFVYESQFGFEAELKTKAETGFVDLYSIPEFDINFDLQEKVRKLPKSELKKLSNLTKNNPIIQKKNWKSILSQAKRFAKHEFELADDGAIKINTQKELKLLISILNRDFNINDASKEKFLTKNKQLIK
jgi:hypothetical protein